MDRKLPITIDTWTVTGFLHKLPIIKEFGQLLSDEMSNIDNPDYDGYEECSFFQFYFLIFLVVVEFKDSFPVSSLVLRREEIEMILERE